MLIRLQEILEGKGASLWSCGVVSSKEQKLPEVLDFMEYICREFRWGCGILGEEEMKDWNAK